MADAGFARIVSGFPKTHTVKVTFNRPPRGNEFADFLKTLAGFYEYNTPYTMLMVPKNMGMGVLREVGTLVRYMKEYEEQHKKYLVKTAVLSDSGVVRAFINATFKIKKPVSDIRTFGSPEEAFEWLGWADKLEAAKRRRAARQAAGNR